MSTITAEVPVASPTATISILTAIEESMVAPTFNETELNFIKTIHDRAVISHDKDTDSIVVKIMDNEFRLSLDKKDFMVSFVMGTSPTKNTDTVLFEFIREINQKFLMWVTEAIVPKLFKYDSVSKLGLFAKLQKIALQIQDGWRREILQNKHYYTSVIYKGNDVWTAHIAKYVAPVGDDNSGQWAQPYVSCKFTNGGREIEFWNHEREPVHVKYAPSSSEYSALLSLARTSAEFNDMLGGVGAFEGDANFLVLILLYKLRQSKKNYSPATTAPASGPATYSSGYSHGSGKYYTAGPGSTTSPKRSDDEASVGGWKRVVAKKSYASAATRTN